jgi:hypothetical protein
MTSIPALSAWPGLPAVAPASATAAAAPGEAADFSGTLGRAADARSPRVATPEAGRTAGRGAVAPSSSARVRSSGAGDPSAPDAVDAGGNRATAPDTPASDDDVADADWPALLPGLDWAAGAGAAHLLGVADRLEARGRASPQALDALRAAAAARAGRMVGTGPGAVGAADTQPPPDTAVPSVPGDTAPAADGANPVNPAAAAAAGGALLAGTAGMTEATNTDNARPAVGTEPPHGPAAGHAPLPPLPDTASPAARAAHAARDARLGVAGPIGEAAAATKSGADAAGEAAAAPAPAAASAPGSAAAVPFAWPASATPPAGTAPNAGASLSAGWIGELPAKLGSAEFAPALGSTLVTLVRDGIEQAQLRLNPADMGPITVQIRIDGTQAQIDFAAAQAATRDALQDAVPALAGALREAGLTLAGGGVFERPRDPQSEPPRGAAGGGAGPRDEAMPAGVAPPGIRRSQGAVDLYA